MSLDNRFLPDIRTRNLIHWARIGEFYLYTSQSVRYFLNTCPIWPLAQINQVTNMTYMRKEERRAGIIAAAVEITLEQGLHAATARAVASRMGCAPAQIHHHFVTAAALRAEALGAAMAQLMMSEESKLTSLAPDEKLLNLMTRNNYKSTALWNEGLIAAREEVAVRIVVSEILDKCHSMLTDIVTEGQNSGIFSADIVPSLVASRLLAICIGLDQLNVIKYSYSAQDDLNEVMKAEIAMLKKSIPEV